MYEAQNIRLTPLSIAVMYIIATLSLVLLALTSSASAAALTEVSVRFDRMKASTATTGTVCAKTGATGQTSVTVTFPTGYTVSGTTGNWATNTTNLAWPTGASAWPTIGATASGVVGQAVTWSSGSLTAGTLYCFNWTNTAALSVGSVGTYTGTVATNVDSATQYATAAIADDQIVVTANVAPSFSFAINANTDDLGTLSSAAVSSSPSPRTATVNTNAKNGWYVWANDTNTGLSSASAAHTIASTTPGTNSTLVAGSEGYNMGVTQTQAAGTGTVTVNSAFVGGSTGKGGGLDTTLRSVASSNGTAQNAVLTLTNNAAVSSITVPATDYTDTITVVGAGLF